MRIPGNRSGHHLAAEFEGRYGPGGVSGLNPGGAEGEFGYNIPNVLFEHAMRNTHIRPGSGAALIPTKRGLSECFIDELAHAPGRIPLEFRRKMLKPKHLAVSMPPPNGRAMARLRPVAITGSPNSWALAAMLRLAPRCRSARNAGLKIHRIVAATNPGHAVNPAQIERQGRRLVRLWPLRSALRRMHGQLAARSSRQISTATT